MGNPCASTYGRSGALMLPVQDSTFRTRFTSVFYVLSLPELAPTFLRVRSKNDSFPSVSLLFRTRQCFPTLPFVRTSCVCVCEPDEWKQPLYVLKLNFQFVSDVMCVWWLWWLLRHGLWSKTYKIGRRSDVKTITAAINCGFDPTKLK